MGRESREGRGSLLVNLSRLRSLGEYKYKYSIGSGWRALAMDLFGVSILVERKRSRQGARWSTLVGHEHAGRRGRVAWCFVSCNAVRVPSDLTTSHLKWYLRLKQAFTVKLTNDKTTGVLSGKCLDESMFPCACHGGNVRTRGREARGRPETHQAWWTCPLQSKPSTQIRARCQM